MTAEEHKQYGREWMLERAAILEFEGGHTRERAEALAVEEWQKLRKTDIDLRVDPCKWCDQFHSGGPERCQA